MNDDTISRQAAIDGLAKFVPYAICDESTESYTNGLKDAYNLICQLPSAQPEPRWIPVTERLPEEQGTYLVSGKWANKNEEIWICDFIQICNIRGWSNEASRPVVQAWMPLPTPYKGGEEE